MKKILVTGSSGTIGTRLCEKFLENRINFIGVDWKRNIWDREIEKKTIHIDLRNKNSVLKKLPLDIDLIIHLAANARVYNLVGNPDLAADNLITTFNILEFARINNIKNFIFASSREVYGNSKKIIHKEDDVNIELVESPYSASKLSGELLIRAYQKCYGINFIIIRFSNIYGKYDISDRVVPLFIKLAKQNKNIIVYGKDKVLDFTYIDDAVNGILLSIKNFAKVKNNVFNIASGKGTKIIDVGKLIIKNLNSKSKLIIRKNRTGEVIKYIADINKAKKLLNYQPKIDLVSGVSEAINWYLKR
jgi:UDP-glucose 4-epimerase